MKKFSYLIIIVLIFSLVLAGCSLLSNVGQVPATEQSGITYLTKHTEGHPFTKDLIADGGDLALAIDVGDVLVWNDGVYLYVKYVTEGGWCLTETHLVVATALEDIPQNKKDNPIPGKFPYQCCYDEDEGEWVFKIKNGGAPSATCDADGDTVATLTEILYTIPLNGWEVCTELFIAAHAVVQKQIGTDELGAPIFQTETAWADGLPFTDRGNWATYFTYIIPELPTISSLDLAGPYYKDEDREFSVKTVNPSCGTEYPHVIFNYIVEGIYVSEINTFDYKYWDDVAGEWKWGEMPKENDGLGNVTGFFGPLPGCFPMEVNYSEETTFRINIGIIGTFPVTITLINCDNNEVITTFTEYVVVLPETLLEIGDSYDGGKVAYIFVAGDPGYVEGEQHGLIAALADYSTKIYWHATNGGITGATETALGTGQANTDKIIALYGTETNAARVCYDYTNVDTGTGVYSDWFLPSKAELNKLYLNKAVIGGFADYVYWSSSEGGVGSAWYQYFSITGTQALSIKIQAVWVRAVRAF